MDTTALASPASLQRYGNADGDGPVAPLQGPKVEFSEFMRALNPLQHIPIIGQIWREATGQTIQPAFRIAGGALMGGPIGVVLAAVSTFVEEAFRGNQADAKEAPVQVASAAPTPTPTLTSSGAPPAEPARTIRVPANPPRRLEALGGPVAMPAQGALPRLGIASTASTGLRSLVSGPHASSIPAVPGHAALPATTGQALPDRPQAPALATSDLAFLPRPSGSPAPLVVADSSQARPAPRRPSRFDASDKPDPLYEIALRTAREAPQRSATAPTQATQPIVTARQAAQPWSARLPSQARPGDPDAAPRDLRGIRLPGPTPQGEAFTARVLGGLAAYDRTNKLRSAASP